MDSGGLQGDTSLDGSVDHASHEALREAVRMLTAELRTLSLHHDEELIRLRASLTGAIGFRVTAKPLLPGQPPAEMLAKDWARRLMIAALEAEVKSSRHGSASPASAADALLRKLEASPIARGRWVRSPIRKLRRIIAGSRSADPTEAIDRRLIQQSGLFDADAYASENPDVVVLGHDLIEHYCKHGGIEGRAAGPFFNSREYLDAYADVASAGLNPLVHYLRHGVFEGREAGVRIPLSSLG